VDCIQVLEEKFFCLPYDRKVDYALCFEASIRSMASWNLTTWSDTISCGIIW